MTRKRSAWEAHALGPLQSAVMESLWGYGPLSAAEVRERLAERHGWAYTTIHTELTRLLKKGLVEKRGRNLETRYATATPPMRKRVGPELDAKTSYVPSGAPRSSKGAKLML